MGCTKRITELIIQALKNNGVTRVGAVRFGNVLGSFVIMELLKMVVPAILPAVFSCYFDIFDGLIQAYVFVFLTALFVKEATE